jgi:DNA replication protein DnaC
MAEINDIKRLALRLNLQSIGKGRIPLTETKMSNLDYLEHILRKELELRDDNVIGKLPSANETNFTESGVTAWQINKLLKFDWLETDSNLIITGKCNSGKTALASRIGREAVKHRHKVFLYHEGELLRSHPNEADIAQVAKDIQLYQRVQAAHHRRSSLFTADTRRTSNLL